ncbi:MAG TPA: 50S ribosomal protein L4 [Gaiellaceae bacterium]|nr:50S ribosomal protein L4 [Gaiellaceae bacterium]
MPGAPVYDASGGKTREVELAEAVFAAEVKPHLVHEVVRSELNARRAGTAATKSRGLVSGGRTKPWRQKGTGRARQGTVRAPHFTGGGHAFARSARSFVQKVNRKVAKAALRSALSSHQAAGSLAVVDPAAFESPSTRQARELVRAAGLELPLVLVANAEDEALVKSFRNLQRVAVVTPDELEVSAVVWARSLLVSGPALEVVEARALETVSSRSDETVSGGDA